MSRRASRSQCGGLQIVANIFLCPVAVMLLSRSGYAPVPWWLCSCPVVVMLLSLSRYAPIPWRIYFCPIADSHDWGNGCWREALPIGMPLTADGTR